jgi:hypothetical protein
MQNDYIQIYYRQNEYEQNDLYKLIEDKVTDKMTDDFYLKTDSNYNDKMTKNEMVVDKMTVQKWQ